MSRQSHLSSLLQRPAGTNALNRLPSVRGLEKTLKAKWRALHKAVRCSQTVADQLDNVLKGSSFRCADYSIVAFGSLARQEFTTGSDLDWTLLVDAAVSDDHWQVACQVQRTIDDLKLKGPGREGTFGTLAFSHDLVHQIGGADDTNRNTTRRILLLLESIPLGGRDAYDRVVRSVLQRYLTEDEAFFHWRSGRPVPRFLLNDFARFWWTMAVDFAYKRRTRQGEGAVLRNLKLRMSRKLIYAAGLLVCFSLALEAESLEELKRKEGGNTVDASARVEHFRERLSLPPLEILAAHLLRHQHLHEAASQIFSAYDRFLCALSDSSQREELEKMKEEGRHNNRLYRQLRQATHDFRDGLLQVFFDDKSGLGELTKTYGVF